jgi:integrase
MGRAFTGGVTAKGKKRIQYDFIFEGVRYRPSVARTPSEANLRRARLHLAGIRERIAAGTFRFADEFPNYRCLPDALRLLSQRTCGEVFNEFLSHCESTLAKGGMAAITVVGYRKILDGVWRPSIGSLPFLSVTHATLVRIADQRDWTRKTYNNAISALRRAFEFGFRDHPERFNPASALKCIRVRKKDRPKIDPFRIQEAESLIAAIHRDWGEAQGNYDEFRFFTGLRPSEQIALLTSDYDPMESTIRITKACVGSVYKDCTKTGDDRVVVLCPRARQVLARQLALRDRFARAGHIDHEYLFFQHDGEPIRHLRYAYDRWKKTLLHTPGIRYRRPYAARHSSVSWNLMIGSSPLWVSKQHGHGIATMFRAYTAWTEGAPESEIKLIKKAMGIRAPRGPLRPTAHRGDSEGTGGKMSARRTDSPAQVTDWTTAQPQPAQVAARSFGTLSATDLAPMPRNHLKINEILGGKGGTRTLDPGIMSAVL